jgi:hypothetical protein
LGVPTTDSIRRKLSELPHRPGIYLTKDRFGNGSATLPATAALC